MNNQETLATHKTQNEYKQNTTQHRKTNNNNQYSTLQTMTKMNSYNIRSFKLEKIKHNGNQMAKHPHTIKLPLIFNKRFQYPIFKHGCFPTALHRTALKSEIPKFSSDVLHYY
jgi:hypothetical protein